MSELERSTPEDRTSAVDEQRLAAMLPAAQQVLEEFVAGLAEAPADRRGTGPDLHRLGAAPGEEPTELGTLLHTIKTAAVDAVETAGPGFFGYVPGGGLESSAVGELMARVFNRYTGLADLAPGLVALEDGVLRWLAQLFGLPPGGNGLLTTGGSQAMLSMLVAAREQHLGEELTGGRIYLSEQAHQCVQKAARIAGLPRSAIRLVPGTDGRHLDPAAVAEAIAEDRSRGLKPFLLVGTAGTTNAGSVDPLDALASLAQEQGLWFHVDGCYGGFFQLTERGRERLTGIERADSISLDPHKSLFLPYGTGVLLVREPALLAAGHSDTEPGDYLQDLSDTGLPDYARLGSELTRDPRGLRLWLPLHLHGVGAFRAALDEKLDLAEHAYQVLAEIPDLVVPEAPELSTVVFRHRADERATRELLERVNGTRRLFCSSTRLDGRLTIRLCVLSHRTHREHVDEALEVIDAACVALQE